MSFPTAVAGPSRLPHIVRPLAAAGRRGYAAPAARKRREDEPQLDGDGKPVSGVMDEIAPDEVPAIWRWFRSYGDQYRLQPEGQRAKWIGGHIVSRAPERADPSHTPPTRASGHHHRSATT